MPVNLMFFLAVHRSIDFFKLPTSCTFPLFFNNMYVTLRSSTCFEQHAAHPQGTNCITTASGIVTLCKQLYSMQVESGLQSALNLHSVRLFTEGDDTRGCGDTICPPEDEQRAARNMLRIVV